MRRSILALTIFSCVLAAAPPNRVTGPVDARRVRAVRGGTHRLAQPEFDRGAVSPSTRLDHIVLMTRMTAGQQSDLDRLLADQQNPSSPEYRKWLTPEEFGERFGLSASDHSKIVAWLAGEGFQMKESGRSRNFVAFSGTAAQVERSLRAPLRRYDVDGEKHMANAAVPSVPEALADVIDGFIGLDDFQLRSQIARTEEPNFNSGATHYLAPEDFATIYNLAPLYKAGIDGTGQSMVIVGQSQVSLTDLRAFRTRFNLPANDPRMLTYSTTDPGFTSSQLEGHLDLEWAGAIAPKATIYYVYGTSAVSAFQFSVINNIAPVISISYGGCETDYGAPFYRTIAQQAAAQGMTVLASSGDSGAAGCDRQGTPIATRGRTALFPTVLPEITSVGGTQFVEGEGRYWAATNSANGGSALSYIPEAVWNETSPSFGIVSGGGGASAFHSQPLWQRGPGIPEGGARLYPDISFTAAVHDGYLVTYAGGLFTVGGTSASAPAAAGLIALLNQAQAAKGLPSGQGNLNPQLYRLAQAAPSVFHDIIRGDNIVPCAQGTPDCMTGSIGDRAAAGWDMAAGLGSIDADELVKNWNLSGRNATVSLVVSSTRPSLNDTVYATALVNGAGGTPTGRVEFSFGALRLGAVELVPRGVQGQAADIEFPAWVLGATGTATLAAHYSGDSAFNQGGATRNLTLLAPVGLAAVGVSYPTVVWPTFPDAEGFGWQTRLTIRELGGVPVIVQRFRIDDEEQPLSRYFPSPNIPANGSVLVNLIFRRLAAPLTRKFEFAGIDANGAIWSRTLSVMYMPTPSSVGFYLTATPLTVTRTSDPGCEWPVQVSVDELDGRGTTLNALFVGTFFRPDISAVFGTDQLPAWGSLQGTVCFNGIVPPATGYIQVNGSNGFVQQVLVSFAGPPQSPTVLTTSPATVTLTEPGKNEATIDLSTTDRNQQWSVAVYPMSRMAGWLTVTPRSGIGPGKITLSAKGSGYGPGAYRALLVIQSPNGSPQTVTVPVMFVLGAAGSGMTISSVSNAASGTPTAAPGMLMAIYGSGLENVTAAVNGIAATVLYASPAQVNIRIPYEVGAGPAVVGLNNENGVVGAHFQMAPAAPGVFADSLPAEVRAGAVTALYMTGAGELAPVTFTATPPVVGSRPLLPLSVTIGGVPAFVDAAGAALRTTGVEQVNFIPAPNTPEGEQPLVVTVGGVASKPVTVVVKK